MQPTDNEDTHITINKMPSRNNRTGRIHPHQRDTNDDVPILGASLEGIAGKDYLRQYNETMRLGMNNQLSKGLSLQEYQTN
jgi:hypothetical protein